MLEDHPTTEDLAREDQVFGRNIFNTRNLTFEPSVNLATPANYRLGPGDEVIIDIWGASPVSYTHLHTEESSGCGCLHFLCDLSEDGRPRSFLIRARQESVFCDAGWHNGCA